MANIVFGGALSHSPMMNFPTAQNDEQVVVFRKAVAELGNRLRRSRPDVVIVFGPDHFRTLFYDLMPAFVIGIDRLDGWGDWNTPTGPFRTNPPLARHILTSVIAEGFEPAFSREMKVDHGVTQPLQLMNLAEIAIIAIIVNAAAPPLPTPARCHAFGAAVARALESWPEEVRVAVLGSGGLSHDPPAPSQENAVHGRTNGFAANRERETVLMRKADVLKARINPDWDRLVLTHLSDGKARALAEQLTTDSIFETAGNGGQEIRTWLATAGAVSDRKMETLCYEPISQLITGMGVVST
jgi:2,3-dihydroxyphenylpropionate 1,2-dioxygenase